MSPFRSLLRVVRQKIAPAAALALFATAPACSKKEAPVPEPAEKASPAIAAAVAPQPEKEPAGPPLKIAYSDWPGWVAWDIGVQKGWFREANVPVEFVWFEYVPSMEAYSAGKVDAVTVTNGDALVTGSSGAPSVCIIANDYSNGNDMVVGKPGITKVADLKGKKVGVEVGFVSHLLLLNALKSAGLAQKDIKIVNVPTDQTPQTLKSGTVDAIVAWQPNSGAALREVPGSTPLYTSANVPGIIYDFLCVNPKTLAERKQDWVQVAKVWDRIAKFVKDPKNLGEASKIMGARVGLEPEKYAELMKGTYFLDLEAALPRFESKEGLESFIGSSKTVDEFNVQNAVYKAPMKVEDYFDSSITALALQKSP